MKVSQAPGDQVLRMGIVLNFMLLINQFLKWDINCRTHKELING